MNCDMCGKARELFRATVEGTDLKVCETCGKFGKIIGKVKLPEPAKQQVRKEPAKPEQTILIVEGYGAMIKKKREQLKMTQKEFAQKLSVRESTLTKIETEDAEPDMELAQKLQKMLGLRLIEEFTDTTVSPKKTKGEELTLGDFVKVRKR